MGIIIRNINGEFHLENVSHSPINFTPFTKPNLISDFVTYMKVGELKYLGDLEIDKEYSDLDCYKDFEIVERIPQVKHDNGLVYDDLIFILKTII